jgi:hypothetical protein
MTTTQGNTSENLAAMLAIYRKSHSAGVRKALLAMARLPLLDGETRHLRPSELVLLQVGRTGDGERFYVQCSRDGEVLLGLSGSHGTERDALRSFAGLVMATL